ncbi:sensor histidine kinase [Streptomyces aidingensis]|uniref:histidine kinase n=1 Tax=Streptomyces aidingensis TaxID=910347 RepID=A0A1I1GRE3_9ACTN|nr:histidine kinase [Streptomyces aidingensis]SFC14035.1 Histidine kinase [Streptomyces aidingensis]
MREPGAERDGGGHGRAQPSQGSLWWWPRRRSVVFDAVLAFFSALESALQGIGFADRTGLPVLPVLIAGALAGAMLLLRRQWPVAVVLVGISVLPASMGVLMAFIGLYTLATSEAPRRITASLAGMVGVGTTIVTYLNLLQDGGYQEQSLPGWFTLVIAAMFGMTHVVPPVLFGMYARARRRLVESLRERADGLERELGLLAERAEERAEWARREERTRIAREMHDVVAHRVSLMVVHSAALQAVAPKDPEKAARNAALIGDMGRQALSELRTMLGVLRSDDRGPAPSGAVTAARLAALASSAAGPSATGGADDGTGTGGPDGRGGAGGPGGAPDGAAGAGAAAGSPPAGGGGPRLGELPALVEQSRATGLAVELTVEGTPRRYAAQVEGTAYRVVQEALTNVHKHAAGAATRIRLAHRPAEIAVQVQNAAPATGGGAADGPGARLPSGGNGLVGMRERVTALGGGFVSGPTDDGGFRVSAVIPAAERAAGPADGPAAEPADGTEGGPCGTAGHDDQPRSDERAGTGSSSPVTP